jgi:hypothetical protein
MTALFLPYHVGLDSDSIIGARLIHLLIHLIEDEFDHFDLL